MRKMSIEERFWPKVKIDEVTGCWNWIASKRYDGYGDIMICDKKYYVHRVSYELLIGAIPEGLELDHLCRNRLCVNPNHLEPVTPRENVLRSNNTASINAKKTHCQKGHEFTHENTRIEKSGSRRCRICERLYKNIWSKNHNDKINSYQRNRYHKKRGNMV